MLRNIEIEYIKHIDGSKVLYMIMIEPTRKLIKSAKKYDSEPGRDSFYVEAVIGEGGKIHSGKITYLTGVYEDVIIKQLNLFEKMQVLNLVGYPLKVLLLN